ncbi:hypothetical protein LZA78_08040 [Sinirhodobacter sp. WL0062]|uniref:Uncharacterized protein n=1 Tax=Rhodobacter flavimaris TaxID=2907145 RepID=A0ABS8YU92_9RHOB|nr:hypothetical protein [Sinirhodobacter sp. WL0062]MCE5973426.1 hypothetical protein [Sinirhodobacter sp. WL0062]
MQRWQDDLTKHPINTSLQKLIEGIDLEVSITDPVIEVERARFSKVVYLLRDTIASLDADIAPFDILNQIQSQFQNQGVIQTMTNLIRTKDANIFRDLNTQITPSLSYINQLRASTISPQSGLADRESALIGYEKFVRSLRAEQTRLEEFYWKTEENIKESTNEALSLKETAKTSADQFEENIKSWKEEISALITAQKTEFTTRQHSNDSQFLETINLIKETAKEWLDDFQSDQTAKADRRNEETRAILQEIIEDSNDKHLSIIKLYELVALDSVTGGHKNIADREFKAAQLWRRVTIGSIAATITWILFSIFCFTPTLTPAPLFWLQIAKSLSLTALLLSFAVYASKQAALHRINERKARSFFLQVQAFDPFIASLPEDTQHEMKKSLSVRIFGPDDPEHDKTILENGDFKVLEKFLGLAEQFKKVIGK